MNTELEQTFFQRSHRSQQIPEKVLNITTHQRNENKNFLGM